MDIRKQVHVHYLGCGDGFKGLSGVYGIVDVYICQDIKVYGLLYVSYNLKLFLKYESIYKLMPK